MSRISGFGLLVVVAILGAAVQGAKGSEAPARVSATATDNAQPLEWLKSGAYAALETYYSQQQQAYEAGGVTDENLYASFKRLYEDAPQNERFFNGWVAAYPSSYAAILARGVYLYRMAWAARGEQSFADTPQSQITAMKNLLARARPDLLASLQRTGKPYLSALYLLNAAMLAGTAAERRQWFERGTAIDPGNSLLRIRYMFSLRPRWGGSYPQMRAFLEQCEKQNLPPKLLARLKLLIHADLAEDAMRGSDNRRIFDEWRQVLDLAAAGGEEPSTEALIGFTRAAQDLNRPEDAERGVKLLEDRNPRDAWSQSRLGWIFIRAHKDDKAWTFLMRAAEQNDPWAQFVVGHTTYDGEPALQKSPDREAGLVWIRRSAEQCYPDAVQFLAARGERQSWSCRLRFMRNQDWWVALIPALGALLPGLLAATIARKRKDRTPAPGQPGRMQHQPATLALAILALSLLLGLAVFASFNKNGTEDPLIGAVLVGLGALAALIIAVYLRSWHQLTTDGLEFGRLLGPRGSLKWRDVTRITYSRLRRSFRIETASGRVVRISATLTGTGEFARAVLERVPSYAIDDTTRDALQRFLPARVTTLAS